MTEIILSDYELIRDKGLFDIITQDALPNNDSIYVNLLVFLCSM